MLEPRAEERFWGRHGKVSDIATRRHAAKSCDKVVGPDALGSIGVLDNLEPIAILIRVTDTA